jgi:hypothetical protein
MKTFQVIFAMAMVFCTKNCVAGHQMAAQIATDTVKEITLSYRTRNNLLVVPVMINDSIKVNLILDPNCKAVILFGKRFQKLLAEKKTNSAKASKRLTGYPASTDALSLNNKISIGPAMGENVPIVILPNQNALNFFTSVNGIMGYEILSRFEITLDPKTETITIGPEKQASVADNSQ